MEGVMATIYGFAADFVPRYWLPCNGGLYPISQNTALFSLLGTTYGGNGMQTFAVPDLRGRVAVGAGQGMSYYELGQMSGTPTETLIMTNLPPHNHTAGAIKIAAANNSGNLDSPNGNILATPAGNYTSGIYSPTSNSRSNQLTVSTGITGTNQPVNIMQPYLAIHFVICAQGVFPSRN